jgi:hypothetical protein
MQMVTSGASMSTALLQPPVFWNRFGDLSKLEGFRSSQDWSATTSLLKDYIEGASALISGVQWQWNAQGILFTKTAQPGFERKRPVKIYGLLPTESMVSSQKVSSGYSQQNTQWMREACKGTLNLSGASEGRLHLALVLGLLESSSVIHGPLEIQLSTIDPYPIEIEEDQAWVIHLKAVTEGVLFVGSPGGFDAHVQYPLSRLPSKKRIRYQLTWVPEFGLSGAEVPYLEASHLGRVLDKVLAVAGLSIESLRFSDGLPDGDSQQEDAQASSAQTGHLAAIKQEGLGINKDALGTCKVLATLVSLDGAVPMASLQMARLELNGICSLERFDEADSAPLTEDSQNRLLQGLRVSPSARCSGYRPADRPGSIRLGQLQLAEQEASWTLRVRSFQHDWVVQVEDQLQALFQLMGATVTQSRRLSGWSPAMTSLWVRYMVRTYKSLFDRPPEISPLPVSIQAMHFEALGTADNHLVLGPSLIYDQSNSEPKVDVKSIRKCWDYLVMALKWLPEHTAVTSHHE